MAIEAAVATLVASEQDRRAVAQGLIDLSFSASGEFGQIERESTIERIRCPTRRRVREDLGECFDQRPSLLTGATP